MKQTMEISIDQIKPNRSQPRLSFNDDGIFELAQSIRENGLIQPIVVRLDEQGTYELIAGERRYRACMLAGLTLIPAILMDVNDLQSAQLALIENIQREDLSAIEEAKAYQAIIRANGYTQEEFAKKVGKSQSTIANKLRLLELPPEIQEGVIDKDITERHARALLSLDQTEALDAYHKVIDKGFNVKQTEDYVKAVQTTKENKEKKSMIRGFSRNQKIAINTIKQAVDMVKKMGVDIEMQEEETIFDHRIIVKFPKD